MILNYREEMYFITTFWAIYDADERDWFVGENKIVFTSAIFKNFHTQAWVFARNGYVWSFPPNVKKKLFFNVLDHINVAYEYNISTTPNQIPHVKFTYNIKHVIVIILPLKESVLTLSSYLYKMWSLTKNRFGDTSSPDDYR